ncbi:putative periplasmic serine endoprotease DegP-like precursor [Planctomycetes bacterium Pan216]|uniref:Putative periplasmic serine endoprotease DegP-like n=1 Tax=Kolteria novifilia TaxID=2527975 RepID=A0A518B163_9BACT|nr:putative periplasmic serine endoprotease DegP-like precursor [Planctomycetes bacterium Pan216]
MSNESRVPDAIRQLVPLRGSGDLTADENALVDQFAASHDECQAELEAHARCLDILQQAAADPCPTDDRPSLWDKIQPELKRKPVVRYPSKFGWISTNTIGTAVACSLVLTFGVLATTPPGEVPLSAGGNSQPAGDSFVDFNRNIQNPQQRTVQPYIGVHVTGLTPALARKLGLTSVAGAVVTELLPKSPASEVMQPGDVIVGFHRHPVFSPAQLGQLIDQCRFGETVRIQFVRQGKLMETELNIGVDEASRIRPAVDVRQPWNLDGNGPVFAREKTFPLSTAV